jgi:hypothetical protein
MKRGDTQARVRGDMTALVWKDKDVHMLTCMILLQKAISVMNMEMP